MKAISRGIQSSVDIDLSYWLHKLIYHDFPGFNGAPGLMGYRQMVRHRILVPIFVGSNPTSPVCNMINIAKFSFFIQLSLRSSSPTGLIKGASNVPEDLLKSKSVSENLCCGWRSRTATVPEINLWRAYFWYLRKLSAVVSASDS